MGSPLMSMITNVQKPERQGFLQRRPTLPHIDEACSQGTSEDSEKGRKNVSLEFEQAVCGCRTSVLLHVDAYVGGWVSVGFMKKVTKPTLAHLTIIPSILKVEGNHQAMKATTLDMIKAVVAVALLFQVGDDLMKENTQTNVRNGEVISDMVIWWLEKQIPFACNLVKNIKPKYLQLPKVSINSITKEGNLQERDIQKLKDWSERLTDELLTLPVDALLGGVEKQRHEEIKEEIAQCHGEELLLDMKEDLKRCKRKQKKPSNAKKGVVKISDNALQKVTQHWHDITDAGWTLEEVLGPWAASARMQGFTDLDFRGEVFPV